MSVSEKIEELSEEIKNTKRYKAYKETKEAFQKDENAKSLLERFQRVKGEVAIWEEQGFEGLRDKHKEEERLSREVLKNKTIQDYMKARTEYEKMVEELAVAISTEIDFPIKMPEKKSCCGKR